MINNLYKCSVRLIQLLYAVRNNKNSRIIDKIYPKNKKNAFFAVIAGKLVDIVFQKTIDRIK